MGKHDVKLIGTWVSPFTLRARIALNLKSIDYDFLEEKPLSKSDLLLKSNPVHKKIPVLLHHDRPICESLIIVQYIDEAWSSGPSILPSDPHDRATARFWGAFLDDKFFPPLKQLRGAEPEEVEKKMNDVREALALLEEAFVKISKGKPFFGGDEIGYIDIAFGGFLGWVGVREKNFNVKFLDEAKVPHLVGWVKRFCAHPAVKDIMQNPDDLIEWVRVHLGPPPTKKN
ncbi:Glutathione S-transferase [Ancistrocladus abbreviatus]